MDVDIDANDRAILGAKNKIGVKTIKKIITGLILLGLLVISLKFIPIKKADKNPLLKFNNINYDIVQCSPLSKCNKLWLYVGDELGDFTEPKEKILIDNKGSFFINRLANNLGKKNRFAFIGKFEGEEEYCGISYKVFKPIWLVVRFPVQRDTDLKLNYLREYVTIADYLGF